MLQEKEKSIPEHSINVHAVATIPITVCHATAYSNDFNYYFQHIILPFIVPKT
jgi:hypothetical protein